MMQSEYTHVEIDIDVRLLAEGDDTEWAQDVAPPTTALYVAAALAAIVVMMLAWNFLLTRACERKDSNKPMSMPWSMILESESFGFHTLDDHGNFTTQLLIPICAIPPLLVLAGLQYNFQVTLAIVICFPALLLSGAALLMLKIRAGIVRTYRDSQQQGATNRILEMQLRTFQIQTLFADPDEPISRVLLIGLSQLMLLGFYVWGLWDAGRPDFSDRRLYGYYYAGIFLQLAYVVGKARSQQSEKDKAHDAKRRDSVPSEDPITYQSVFYHCAKFWAFFSGGVLLFKDDFMWATQGNELTRTPCNIRYTLDLLVNTAGVFYIMIGLPIQVSHNMDPIDFVLNVVAAFYIVELDDIDGKVVQFANVCAVKIEPVVNDDEESNETETEQALRKGSDPGLDEAKKILVSSLSQEELARLSGILREM